MAQREIAGVSKGAQRRAFCPNCRTGTSLELLSGRPVWPEFLDTGSKKLVTAQSFAKLQIWRCTFCDKTTLLLQTYAKDKGDYELVNSEQVWPYNPPRELQPEAPAAVQSLYREAALAESVGALRAAAVLYRAAVEEIADDRGAQGGNLKDRIDDLVAKGVDADLVGYLHEARTTGNWSIHEGIEFSPEEIGDVAMLIRHVVEVLYAQPARRDAMRQARKERIESRTAPAPEDDEARKEGPST
jgi:hypothetical protein